MIKIKKILLLTSIFSLFLANLTSFSYAQNSFASQSEIQAFKKGVLQGLQVGAEFKENEIKYKLYKYKDLINSVFDYKIFLIAGKVLPPFFEYKLYYDEKNGEIIFDNRFIVKSPAFFPIELINSIKNELLENIKTISNKYIVYENTKNLDESKIRYHYFLAKKMYLNPVYIYDKDMLIFADFRKVGDAKNLAQKLQKLGINAKTIFVKNLMHKDTKATEVAKQIEELAKLIYQKEKQAIYHTKIEDKDKLIKIYKLILTARDLTLQLSSFDYPNFNKIKLYNDLNQILRNIYLYLKYKYNASILEKLSKDTIKLNANENKLNKENNTKTKNKTSQKNILLNEENVDKILKEFINEAK